MSEEALQDRITVLESENRALRVLENMDIKLELRNAIDKIERGMLQLKRIAQLAGGTRDERSTGSTSTKPRKGSPVHAEPKDALSKGRASSGTDTGPMQEMSEAPDVPGLRDTIV